MIQVCPNCGGLYGAENGDTFSGRACQCGVSVGMRQNTGPSAAELWVALKEQCCVHPATAKRCVMVNELDFRAALATKGIK